MLTGRTALVTGGKRIGQVVAESLAQQGADIVLSYRSSRAEAEETAARVRGLGRRALVLGVVFLGLAIRFAFDLHRRSARYLFLGSLVYLPLIWIFMIATRVP